MRCRFSSTTKRLHRKAGVQYGRPKPFLCRHNISTADPAVLNPSSNRSLRVFAVDEDVVSNSSAKFVRTRFAEETLAVARERSDFDRLKASLFVWLGGTGYRAVESVLSGLAFIASLPKGSGVVFDYAAKHLSLGR